MVVWIPLYVIVFQKDSHVYLALTQIALDLLNSVPTFQGKTKTKHKCWISKHNSPNLLHTIISNQFCVQISPFEYRILKPFQYLPMGYLIFFVIQ